MRLDFVPVTWPLLHLEMLLKMSIEQVLLISPSADKAQ